MAAVLRSEAHQLAGTFIAAVTHGPHRTRSRGASATARGAHLLPAAGAGGRRRSAILPGMPPVNGAVDFVPTPMRLSRR